ncbi:MAG: hypothetical protein H7838_11910, partial [Magnetococcus sp. DMHC-8]
MPAMHFNIGGRVATGFALVLLILVAQGVATITALRVAADHFLAFQRASAATNVIHAMESNVVELQRSVLAYTFSGFEGVLSRIRRVQKGLQRQFEQLHAELQDQRRQDLLKRMEDHFLSHTANFAAALEEHRLRDRLADQEVDQSAREASRELAQLLEQAMAAGQYRWSAHLGLAQEHLLTSHRDALAFQGAPDALLVRDVERRMRLFNTAWQPVSGLIPDDVRERVEGVRIQATRFETGFHSLVRATRAYLHMVHVVMAGEEAEFARLTVELKEATLTEQAGLDARLHATMATARRDALLFTL